MTETKTILLVGRSGRGKSTLANVITNTNYFKESSGSVSETKKNQFEKFEDVSNKINYAIIDTPGIGDTKMSDSEVLDVIAEAVYLAKDGVSQVFFVNDGRFDQHEMATYDLLRTIIFDENITNHTTIVRTRFADFKKSKKCQLDIDLMVKEAQEKKVELEKNIADKEEEIKSLSPGSEQYQKTLNELEKAKKELTSTNLAEIIESCQGRIVYVDNPSTIIDAADNEDENKKTRREKLMNLNEKARNKSREILLKHLNENCQGTSYKPEKLTQLSQEIAEDYFQYLKKKEELQKELENLRNEGLNKSSGVFVEEAEKKQIETNIGIVEAQEIIIQLQDKKDKLLKEIAEKERTIRQKVLKHIFNNYEAINKELGGNIFLNSVTGEHPWPEIHLEFANQELVVKWLSQGFDYQQTKEWASVLGDSFDPKVDAGFCAWLRDEKQLNVKRAKALDYINKQSRSEYVDWLKGEVGILDRHSQQLSWWKETDEKTIRNLLLIGWTGSGKSTLANVLTNRRDIKKSEITKEFAEKGNKCHKCKKEKEGFMEGGNKIEAFIENKGPYFFHEDCFNFKESYKGVSETKDFQAEEFTYEGTNYRVIDTIGIGDTQLPKKNVHSYLFSPTFPTLAPPPLPLPLHFHLFPPKIELSFHPLASTSSRLRFSENLLLFLSG